MNFVAIDFETANEKRHSPCSLGLCVVENNEIVLEKYWLIRPHELRFSPMNIGIHGIREGDVLDASEFDTLWAEIQPLLEGKLVVAHNASFDISVLRRTLELYQLPSPTFDYCCTMVMSRHFYSYLNNAKLNTVNHHLGYTFNHHHAGADAAACAHILLSINEELQARDIHTLCKQVGVKVGQVFPDGYKPAGSNGGGLTSQRSKTYYTDHATGSPYSCTTNFFKNKVVAFTGPLSSMSRSEAIAFIEKSGGDYSPSVTRKTSIVITRTQNPMSLNPNQMSTKLRRAVELIGRGQAIEFIDEKRFLELIK